MPRSSSSARPGSARRRSGEAAVRRGRRAGSSGAVGAARRVGGAALVRGPDRPPGCRRRRMFSRRCPRLRRRRSTSRFSAPTRAVRPAAGWSEPRSCPCCASSPRAARCSSPSTTRSGSTRRRPRHSSSRCGVSTTGPYGWSCRAARMRAARTSSVTRVAPARARAALGRRAPTDRQRSARRHVFAPDARPPRRGLARQRVLRARDRAPARPR